MTDEGMGRAEDLVREIMWQVSEHGNIALEGRLKELCDQARKEGFEAGYKKGVEEQFDESEAVTVKASRPTQYERGFAQAREMAANVCSNAHHSIDPIELAFKIRAIQPPRDGER